MGFLEVRGNSSRVLHYVGFHEGKRIYEKHNVGNQSSFLHSGGRGFKSPPVHQETRQQSQKQPFLFPSTDSHLLPHENIEVYLHNNIGVYSHADLMFNGVVDGGGLIGFDGFADFLRGRGLRERYVRDLVCYARRFSWLLGDAEAFARVGGLKGARMILSALANLSRYLGRYDDFRRMVVKCGVRWENGDSLNSFMRFFIGCESVAATEKWLMDVRAKVDGDDWFVVRFMALTGLRTREALYCLNKIAAVGVENYPYNEEYGVLEHFRDGWFLRKSKKAFLSIITPSLLECLRSRKRKKVAYEGLRSRFRRLGLDVRFYDLRRYFATALRLRGVEVEVIDICQGRCSRSIFARSYFRPDVSLVFSKVRSVVVELDKTLS